MVLLIKENVDATEVQDCNDLISHILVAAVDIRGQPRQLVCAMDSIQCRYEACMQARGGNYEQLLWKNMQNCKSPQHYQTFIYVKRNVYFKLKRANNSVTFAFHSL
jgi:hypothetical protein